MRNHIHKEENILFEAAHRCLSAEQDDRVVTEINKFQIDPKSLADLRRLEWAYLSRAACHA